jgi:hypothetical protein
VQDCWQAWEGIIGVLDGGGWICGLLGMPELTVIFEGCAFLCEMCMYVCCWGG